MKKLILELDALDVESFPTGTADEKPGTVRGHITRYCSDDTCDPCNTMACSYYEQCMPTLDGLTCMYETCGTCNQTDRNCTNYCP
jgi:hypothetical protein